jgi:hypothetical protein
MRSMLALVGWFGVTAVAAGLAYTRHGGLGLFLALALSQGAFWLGMIAASQYLFAMPSGTDRLGAFLCLLGWLMGSVRSCIIVKNGKAEVRIKGGAYAAMPGVLLIDSASAVVLERDGQPSNVHGPGTWYMEFGESIRGAVDMRVQTRDRKMQALTRDGIYVDTSVSVTFQIDPGDVVAASDQPYVFSAKAVLHAVYETPVGKAGITDWGDAVVALAANELLTLIAQRDLDELYMPQNPVANPRKQMKDELERRVKEVTRELGVVIRGANFSVPQPPEVVTEQRVRTWQARWAGQVLETYAEGEARALEHIERARAQAQMEMIKGIVRGFDQLAQSGTPIPKELIVLRLIEALERMVGDPQTREMLPQDTLKELARFIDLPDELQPPPKRPDLPAAETPGGGR